MELKELINECADAIYRSAVEEGGDNAVATVNTQDGWIDILWNAEQILVDVYHDNDYERASPNIEKHLTDALASELSWDDMLDDRVDGDDEPIYTISRYVENTKPRESNAFFAR